MESAIGYVVLTAFMVFVLLSSTSGMMQYASTANALSAATVKTNLLELIREQLIEAYRGSKMAGCSLAFYISVPKSIQGKMFTMRIDSSSKSLALDYSGSSISTSLPSFSAPAVVWSESRYVSGNGMMWISTSWAAGSIAISVSGG
jgi:hypothetical protein